MKAIKEILWVGFLTMVFVSSYHLAFGAEISYDFQTIDIAIPGHPEAEVWLVDLNDKEILLQVETDSGTFGAIAKFNERKNKLQGKLKSFDCGETSLESINNRGQIIGACDLGAFLREPDGSFKFLHFGPQVAPAGTGLYQVSDDGHVSGWWSEPAVAGGLNFNALSWHPLEGYRTIDAFPLDPTRYFLQTQELIGRDGAGRALGRSWVRSSPSPGIIDDVFVYWVYDNGTFDFPFPPALDVNGSRLYELQDMNKSSQKLGVRFSDGKIIFEDDGVFFDVALPTGWFLANLGGLNDDAQFVGNYAIQVGTRPCFNPPTNLCPTFDTHGFVATPKPIQAAKKASLP